MPSVFPLTVHSRPQAFLRLMRPFNNLLANSRILIGYALGSFFLASQSKLVVTILAYVLMTLLHGGIYAMNDLFDLELDRKHPQKIKHRPLAAGKVKPQEARFLAFGLISFSLSAGFFLSKTLFFFQLVFLIINVLYSWKLKHWPYFDILCNSITHPLRTLLGLTLAHAPFASFAPMLLTEVFIQMSLASVRRIREYTKRSMGYRPSLRFYTLRTLQVLFIGSYTLALFHLLFTWNQVGMVWRIVIVTVGTLVGFGNKRGTFVHWLVNVWQGYRPLRFRKIATLKLFEQSH